MSESRAVIAIHEIRTSPKADPIAPGTEFKTADHADLVERGAGRYPDEPEQPDGAQAGASEPSAD